MSIELERNLNAASKTISRQQKQIEELRSDLARLCDASLSQNMFTTRRDLSAGYKKKYGLGVEVSA